MEALLPIEPGSVLAGICRGIRQGRPAGRTRRPSRRAALSPQPRRRSKCRYCSGILPANPATMVKAGSGTGQHVVDFAGHTPGIIWWPSDLNPNSTSTRASPRGGRIRDCRTSVEPPRIDLSDPAWRPRCNEGSVRDQCWRCARASNVVHTRALAGRRGLPAGAGRHLPGDGWLFLYGPFKAMASIPRSATCGVRYQACARAIPNGACAISRRSKSWPAPPGLYSSKSPRCRTPTT